MFGQNCCLYLSIDIKVISIRGIMLSCKYIKRN